MILSFVPERVLVFEWTFPPDIPSLRANGDTTTVVVLFEESSDNKVQVQLHALGWQSGPDWQAGWAYFDSAWAHVLNAMKGHLEEKE